MLLKKVINDCPHNIKLIDIKGLALDSRKVKKDYLFFAVKGSNYDGNKFIDKAIHNGARVIISSKKISIKKPNIIYIISKNVKKLLTQACVNFFKKKPKNIIAVTGTNGKSSVAEFIYQILSHNKISSIGTLGIKRNNKIKNLKLTSPDIISLHNELMNLKNSNIDNVIIEASSHGLHQGRLSGLNIKAGIFTNFSQDHLDYHKSMNEYFKAKMILFSSLIKKNNFIITDNKINHFPQIKKIANKNKLQILLINKIIKTLKQKENKNELVGSFQFKNLAMSILAANLCGLNMKKISSSIKKIKSVNGRMQLVKNFNNKIKVFVDYAHTPDALQTVLESLKKKYGKNITLVFGCGGERDKKKRPIMAKIANNFCKKIYLTDDNPRNESPKNIRKEIKKKLDKKKFIEIPNRARAIKNAILKADPFETILIAGKGHESTQDYGKKKYIFSDKEIVRKIKVKNKYNFINQNQVFNSQIIKNILKTKKNYKFEGVSINSKETKKNNLFIAIKGENKDGHDYFDGAIRNGANYCIVSKNLKNKKLIRVVNTKSFLNKLAIEKRFETDAKIIAITGSVGKTTLKSLLGNLLSKYENTYYSPKSYNNHFGVPFSLSNLEKNHKYGVFEVGMSKKGEINLLSKMIKPNIAIITNIGEAHLENFKDINHIAKAKSEIIYNIEKNGLLILNKDDNFYNYHKKIANKLKIKTISIGQSKKADIQLISNKKIKKNKILKIRAFNEVTNIKSNNVNPFNILASVAVIKYLKLDLNRVLDIFSKFYSLEGRGKIHKIRRYKTNFTLIDESYNASPFSVKEAILKLSNSEKKNFKKYLLLGDMLELGRRSDDYHRDLSKHINSSDIDKVFVYGKKILNTYKYLKKNKQGNILQNKNDFDEIFKGLIKKNDFLMIKGSNATGLNKISNSIIKGSNVI